MHANISVRGIRIHALVYIKYIFGCEICTDFVNRTCFALYDNDKNNAKSYY